jgi:hypothetical protein
MIRRGKQAILSVRWNDRDTIRSTGLGWVNLKASWIAFVYSYPRESTRLGATIDSKVLQMRFSRQPKVPIKGKD